ncbi:MAG TPA: glycogen debranching enzyme N-terminal domain-containing protein, partial [Nannocystaceae bacterium]|nr:glycogen debranching enzyme N-terminal domain-containing protein [Nannocystaceae bacterium]
MDEPTIVQRMPWSRGDVTVEPLLTREWLVTNGLGGYAAGTVGGVPTRRYHGSLNAALPAPHGRTMMLSYLSERVRLQDGTLVQIGGEERTTGELAVPTAAVLEEFRLEAGLPTWRYHAGDAVIEKRMVMPYRQNTMLVRYRLLAGPATARVELQPALHFRGHDAMVDTPDPGAHVWTISGDRYEVSAGEHLPPLRLRMLGAQISFTHSPQSLELQYRAEQARG